MFIIGIYPMFIEIRKGSFDFFNLKNPFIIYFIIQLGVSGAITCFTGKPSEIGLDPVQYAEYYELALGASVAALLCFQIGYYVSSNRIFRLPRLFQKQWVISRYKKVTILYYLIGSISFLLLLYINGGYNAFMENRESWRAGDLTGQGFLLYPSTSLLSIALIVYLLGYLNHLGDSKINAVGLIVLVAISSLPSFFLGFRSSLVLPFMQIMLIMNYRYSKISRTNMIVFLMAIALIFTGYGILRSVPAGIAMGSQTMYDMIKTKPELVYSVVSRSKGAEVVAAVINKIDQTQEYGSISESIIEAVTIFIPKRIWENKPQPMSEKFTTLFFERDLRMSRGYDRSTWGGISPTSVGHFYWMLGWLGILIGHFVLGYIAKLVYNTFIVNMDNNNVMLLYSIVFITFIMFAEAIQGYVNSLTMHLIVIIATIMLLTVNLLRKSYSIGLS